jgi:hypothetical protein
VDVQNAQILAYAMADQGSQRIQVSQVLPEPERESVRLLAIGSQQGVISMIQQLHKLELAEVAAWSSLLPGPNPGEVVSILTLNFAVS